MKGWRSSFNQNVPKWLRAAPNSVTSLGRGNRNLLCSHLESPALPSTQIIYFGDFLISNWKRRGAEFAFADKLGGRVWGAGTGWRMSHNLPYKIIYISNYDSLKLLFFILGAFRVVLFN